MISSVVSLKSFSMLHDIEAPFDKPNGLGAELSTETCLIT